MVSLRYFIEFPEKWTVIAIILGMAAIKNRIISRKSSKMKSSNNEYFQKKELKLFSVVAKHDDFLREVLNNKIMLKLVAWNQW